MLSCGDPRWPVSGCHQVSTRIWKYLDAKKQGNVEECSTDPISLPVYRFKIVGLYWIRNTILVCDIVSCNSSYYLGCLAANIEHDSGKYSNVCISILYFWGARIVSVHPSYFFSCALDHFMNFLFNFHGHYTVLDWTIPVPVVLYCTCTWYCNYCTCTRYCTGTRPTIQYCTVHFVVT